jgi:hypothetical protein
VLAAAFSFESRCFFHLLDYFSTPQHSSLVLFAFVSTSGSYLHSSGVVPLVLTAL